MNRLQQLSLRTITNTTTPIKSVKNPYKINSRVIEILNSSNKKKLNKSDYKCLTEELHQCAKYAKHQPPNPHNNGTSLRTNLSNYTSQIFQKLEQRFKFKNEFDSYFSCLINGHAIPVDTTFEHSEALNSTELVLSGLEQMYKLSGIIHMTDRQEGCVTNPAILPDAYTLINALRVIVRDPSSNEKSRFNVCISVLEKQLEYYQQSQLVLKNEELEFYWRELLRKVVAPDIISFNIALQSLNPANTITSAHLSPYHAIKHINTLLNLLQEVGIKPDGYTYNALFQTLASLCAKSVNSKHNRLYLKEATFHWNMLLDQQLENTKLLNSYMNVLSKAALREACNYAEDLLNSCLVREANSNGSKSIEKKLIPDVYTVATMLDCYARQGEHFKSIRLFEKVRAMKDFELNSYVLNAVLNAFVKISKTDQKAADRAEQLLLDIEAEFLRNCDVARGLKPCIMSYAIVMNCWAQSSANDAYSRAERLYRHVYKSYEEALLTSDDPLSEEVQRYKPNQWLYTGLLNVYANSGKVGSGKRAIALLETIPNPATSMFNVAISAVSRDESCHPREAENILRKMEKYAIERQSEVSPDTITYSTVINAWSNSKLNDNEEQAERLLNEMERICQLGSRRVVPNTVTYTSVISAWANSNKDGFEAKTEELLQRMQVLYESGVKQVKPNAVSFTCVMKAWSRSKLAYGIDRARDILYHMEKMYYEGDNTVKPTSVTYSTIISGYRSFQGQGSGEKATKAFDILMHMIRQHEKGNEDARPNTFIYNNVLTCCLTTQGDIETRHAALDIALKVFSMLKDDRTAKINSYTYGTMVKAYGLLENQIDKREGCVVEIFEQCCDDGLVTEGVLRELHRYASVSLFASLTGCEGFDHESPNFRAIHQSLPYKWKENATRRETSENRAPMLYSRQSGTRMRKHYGAFTEDNPRSR